MTSPPKPRPARQAHNFLHSGENEPLNATIVSAQDSSKCSETSNRSRSLPLDGAAVVSSLEGWSLGESHPTTTVLYIASSKLCKYRISCRLWSPSSNEGEQQVSTRATRRSTSA